MNVKMKIVSTKSLRTASGNAASSTNRVVPSFIRFRTVPTAGREGSRRGQRGRRHRERPSEGGWIPRFGCCGVGHGTTGGLVGFGCCGVGRILSFPQGSAQTRQDIG